MYIYSKFKLLALQTKEKDMLFFLSNIGWKLASSLGCCSLQNRFPEVRVSIYDEENKCEIIETSDHTFKV